jgi:hypothetical protein
VFAPLPRPIRARTALLLVLASALSMTLGAAGCGSARAEEYREVPPAAWPGSARLDGDTWQSSDPPPLGEGDAWLRFEGRIHLRVHHPLGRRPMLVVPYVSFYPGGQGGAVAAGDLARIEAVDEEAVTLYNATNEDFFVRLVVR